MQQSRKQIIEKKQQRDKLDLCHSNNKQTNINLNNVHSNNNKHKHTHHQNPTPTRGYQHHQEQQQQENHHRIHIIRRDQPHHSINSIIHKKMSHEYIFKYIIIGDMGVGKSCLLNQVSFPAHFSASSFLAKKEEKLRKTPPPPLQFPIHQKVS